MADGGAAAEGDGRMSPGPGGAAPGRVAVGSVWPSKTALRAAVVMLSESLDRPVRVSQSTPRRMTMKCMTPGCAFHISAKDVRESGWWIVVRVRVGHDCRVTTKRARNYSTDLVMCTTGSFAREFVPVMGRRCGSGGVVELCRMVRNTQTSLHLSQFQARRYIRGFFGATAEDFVEQLQLLQHYLEQMREMDPGGEMAVKCMCVLGRGPPMLSSGAAPTIRAALMHLPHPSLLTRATHCSVAVACRRLAVFDFDTSAQPRRRL